MPSRSDGNLRPVTEDARPQARRTPTGAAVFKPSVTEAITSAAMTELETHGFARLAMERVARGAGVGKSALYRRWPSKLEMVIDLLAQLSVPTGPTPDTGSLRADLRAVLQSTADWLTEPRVRAVLPGLIAESMSNSALAEATRHHVTQPRLEWLRPVLVRAHERGELSSGDVDVLSDLLVATLFWRLTHGRSVDAEYLDRLAGMLVSGVSACANARPRSVTEHTQEGLA